jgi:cyanophycin synthetase
MILTEGLAYDKCAVGVVTDVTGFEELGEFYIDSADRLYSVLRTQVDVILPSGVAVLNAADEQVVEMADLCDGEVMFYGVDEDLPALAAHRKDGKRTVFQRAQGIVLAQGDDVVATLPLSPLVPPEAVLAAIAAAWALGLTPDLIGAGLRTFDSNPKKHHH